MYTRLMPRKDLIAIPVFNEEDSIAPVIKRLRDFYAGDILIVDDGSTDDSVPSLKGLKDSSITILQHSSNLGYGASLIDSFQYALEHDYKRLVTMDCDWQHEPCCVRGFFEHLDDMDVLSGSRYLSKTCNRGDAPPDRRKINEEITARINELTGFGITDAFCGFKAYQVPALRPLRLTQCGYAMPLQFWIQAWHFSLRVEEKAVPLIYLDPDRTFGKRLDDPKVRREYYQGVIEREVSRWKELS